MIIQPFAADDLNDAWLLSSSEGWNQTRRDWQRLVSFQPEGCFAARVDHELAGTVTTTRYGRRLAWIGMMLVAAAHRRQGLATRLMQHAVRFLESQRIECIKLDATPAGRRVYERLGFRGEMEFHRWSRSETRQSPDDSFAATGATVEPLPMEFDMAAFGTDRSLLLQRLAADSHVVSAADGFAFLRPGRLAAYLGPVTAATSSTAERLIDELLRQTRGPVFWDIPAGNSAAEKLARDRGFAPVRDLTRMVLGNNDLMPRYELQFALADPGTG